MQDWTFAGWFYASAGQQIGPVPDEEIRRLFLTGQLKLNERLWKAWKDSTGQYYFFRSEVSVVVEREKPR